MGDARSDSKEWKTYDDLAHGAASDRLPPSDEFVGLTLMIASPGAPRLQLSFIAPDQVCWKCGGASGAEWCEAIEVAPDVFFIDLTFMELPRETVTVIVDLSSRRTLRIRSIVAEDDVPGGPYVTQTFYPGVLEGGSAKGDVPAATRDLTGLYGDDDLTTTYKFAEDQYLTTFREAKVALASVLFLNLQDMRSTGKVLGVTADGRVTNRPAGGLLTRNPMTTDPAEASPA